MALGYLIATSIWYTLSFGKANCC